MNIVRRNITFWLLGFLLLGIVPTFSGFPEKAWADVSADSAGAANISPTTILQIEGGKGFTVLLKKDGTVWTWGNNLRGKLGGGLNNRNQATAISSLSGITAIAVGQSHSLALKSDGTVWAWGENTFGQLGDGTTIDRTTPVQVPDLTHVTAISAGNFHSVVVKDDGTAWSWGDNTYGQLGDSTNKGSNKPVQVKGNIASVKTIASGAYHTLAIDQDGVVWAWGDNYFGELGYGYDQNRLNTPIRSTSSNWHITQIAAGFDFSLALKDDGTVLTWGLIDSDPTAMYNAVNTHTQDENKFPVLVIGLDNVAQITAGNSHAVVLKKDGSVYAWGVNTSGQLGVGIGFDGKTWKQTFPNQVKGLPEVARVGVGSNFTFAIGKDDSLWAWGNNSYSQLGDKTLNNQPSPILTQVNVWLNPTVLKPGEGNVLLKNPKAVPLAAGESDTFVLKNNRLYGWGSNTFGQLGDGTRTSASSPQALSLDGAVSIDAGDAHTVAVKQDGTLWTWGQNFAGQLGDGTTTARPTAAKVDSLSGVIAAAAGSNHTIALLNNGSVWSFGDNTYGQLGHDKTAAASQIVQLSNIVSIAAGSNFNLALENTGKLWAWGDNTSGQLGDGTLAGKQQPVQINGVTGVIAMSAGKNFALALKDDGTVWSWGYNAFGQLGDGTTTNQTKPVKVINLPYMKSVHAGSYHSMALGNDGSVWTWGQNLFGQLGDGSKINQNKPEQIKGIGTADTAAAGGSHSIVQGMDGSIWAWGGNYSGQLGDNTFLNRALPAIVTGLNAKFTDVDGHWAKDNILHAVEKGYANGYSDGSFRPEASITRGEFLKLVVTSLHLSTADSVKDQAWYQPYVDALKKAGIVQESDLQESWDLPITRQEIAAIALRAVSPELQKANAVVQPSFVMSGAVTKGILQGMNGGKLAPDEATTRAQAIIVIDRMLQVQQGITLPVDPLAVEQAKQK
ncbi:S-layer homology domain-containing protein [Paenibacillus sp. N3.4]|uniref:RCC1 domain-containing protein n=1 Tax=Paenibacillus sp. N3.4 TaxID=2603222 RepID=UPI0011CA904B|nr:S-layer homology domain-containing protein [Paenibacillus sp. N3.4]TXK85989.1 RCC1 repeat-containing protein [Paenibacillus sp. N3.4]